MDVMTAFTSKPEQGYIKLPDNPEDWDQEIMSALFSRYPDLAQFMVDLEFTRQDLKQLTAIGGISVAGPMYKIYFPIIIYKGELAPFEVFIDKDGKFNHSTLERVLYNLNFGEAFAAVKKQVFPDTVSPMMGAMYPPFSKPIFKMAEYAESFINRYKELLLSLPGEYNYMDRILTAYGSLMAKLKSRIQATPAISPYDVIQVRPTALGDYKVLLSSNTIYGPIETTVTADQVTMLLSEFNHDTSLAFTELRDRGFYTVIGNDGMRQPLEVLDDVVDPGANAKVLTGAGYMRPLNTRIIQGYYVPKLLEFTDRAVDFSVPFSVQGGIVFNNFSYQKVSSNVAGTKLQGNLTPGNRNITVGDIGMFYFPKFGFGTVPFTVVGKISRNVNDQTDSEKDIQMDIMTDTGKKVELMIGDRNGYYSLPFNATVDIAADDAPTFQSTNNRRKNESIAREFLKEVMEHAIYINLGARTVVPELRDAAQTVIPGFSTALPMFYIAKGAENTYKFSFPGVRDYDNQNLTIPTKIANGRPLNWKFGELRKEDVHFLLAHLGVNTVKADAIIKQAEEYKIAKLTNFTFPKAYSYQIKTAEQLHHISFSEEFLIKLAELSKQLSDDDNATINNVLKLGLMSAEDNQDLNTMTIHVDNVISDFSKLLVMSRLGVHGIDGDKLSASLSELEDVRSQIMAIKPLAQE